MRTPWRVLWLIGLAAAAQPSRGGECPPLSAPNGAQRGADKLERYGSSLSSVPHGRMVWPNEIVACLALKTHGAATAAPADSQSGPAAVQQGEAFPGQAGGPTLIGSLPGAGPGFDDFRPSQDALDPKRSLGLPPREAHPGPEVGPRSARGHAFLSEALSDLRRFAEAEKAAKAALALDCHSGEGYQALGRAQLGQGTPGKLEEAVKSLSRALRLNPKTAARSLSLRAQAYQRLERRDKMLADLEATAALRPAEYKERLRAARSEERFRRASLLGGFIRDRLDWLLLLLLLAVLLTRRRDEPDILRRKVRMVAALREWDHDRAC